MWEHTRRPSAHPRDLGRISPSTSKSGESLNLTVNGGFRLQEHSVELPDEVRGWFASFTQASAGSSEAMVLHTRGSLK